MFDHSGSEWQKALWRILSNPTFEVIGVILVMLLAACVIVETQMMGARHKLPYVFGQK